MNDVVDVEVEGERLLAQLDEGDDGVLVCHWQQTVGQLVQSGHLPRVDEVDQLLHDLKLHVLQLYLVRLILLTRVHKHRLQHKHTYIHYAEAVYVPKN